MEGRKPDFEVCLSDPGDEEETGGGVIEGRL
jgi:hypothetical protein